MLLLDGALTGTVVVVVGERGTILRSSDNARTWQPSVAPARAALTGITFSPDPSPHTGWAVGHDALILGTADAGRTWTKHYQSADLSDSFLDVLALDAAHVIAVGAYGLFLESKDGGKTWARRKLSEDDNHLNRLSRGPTGTLYLAGERGTLLRSSDRGATWKPIPAPYEGSFYGILPLEGRTLLAHGLRGHVYRSVNEGETWERIATPQPALFAGAVRLESNVVVLGGSARALVLSRDFGRTFMPFAEPLAAAIAELIELPDGNLLALGEAGATVLPRPP